MKRDLVDDLREAKLSALNEELRREIQALRRDREREAYVVHEAEGDCECTRVVHVRPPEDGPIYLLPNLPDPEPSSALAGRVSVAALIVSLAAFIWIAVTFVVTIH